MATQMQLKVLEGNHSRLGMATSGVWEFFLDHSLEWFKGALCSKPVKSTMTSILFSQKKKTTFSSRKSKIKVLVATRYC